MSEMIDILPELKRIWDLNIEEDLNEEYLNENIPKDLINAYKNSRGNKSSYNNEYTSNISGKKPRTWDRRQTTVDYYNSTYEEISKQEAKQFLGISLSNSGRASRIYKRRDLEARLRQLRFLINGGVVEFENGFDEKDNLICLTYPKTSIPLSKFQDKGYLGFTRGNRHIETNNLTYGDIVILIDICDKIYKTNEYDNYLPVLDIVDFKNYITSVLSDERNIAYAEARNIVDHKLTFGDLTSYVDEYLNNLVTKGYLTQDKLDATKNILKKRLVNDLEITVPKFKHDTQVAWYEIDKLYKDKSTHLNILDTGDHSRNTYDVISSELYDKLIEKDKLKKKLLEFKGFLKHLNNQDEIDEETLEEYKFNYEATLREYIQICKDVKKILNKVVINVSDREAILKHRLKDKAIFLTKCYKDYKQLEDSIINLEGLTLEDIWKKYSSEFKSTLDEIKATLKGQLTFKESVQREITQSQVEIQRLEQQLEQKRQTLRDQQTVLQETETEILNLETEIQRIEEEDNPTKNAVIKCYEERKKLMTQLQELSSKLKHYSSRKNNKDVSYEENEELLNIIDFVDTFVENTNELENEIPAE